MTKVAEAYYMQVVCSCQYPWPYDKKFKITTTTTVDKQKHVSEWTELYCKKCEEKVIKGDGWDD